MYARQGRAARARQGRHVRGSRVSRSPPSPVSSAPGTVSSGRPARRRCARVAAANSGCAPGGLRAMRALKRSSICSGSVTPVRSSIISPSSAAMPSSSARCSPPDHSASAASASSCSTDGSGSCRDTGREATAWGKRAGSTAAAPSRGLAQPSPAPLTPAALRASAASCSCTSASSQPSTSQPWRAARVCGGKVGLWLSDALAAAEPGQGALALASMATARGLTDQAIQRTGAR